MNQLPFNSGAFNGGSSVAAIVYLPSGNATVEVALNERISVSMSGDTGMGLDLTGDISKVSNLGLAALTLDRSLAGSLTIHRKVYFDPSDITFGFDATGTATTVMLGPSGSSEWGMEVDGALTRVGQLFGSSNQTSDATGTLHNIRLLGGAGATRDTAVTGAMYAVRYLSGAATIAIELAAPTSFTRTRPFGIQEISKSLDMSGGMSAKQYMTGNAELALEGDATVTRIRTMNGPATLSISATGSLVSQIGFGFQTLISSLDATGQMSATRYLQGNTGYQKDWFASLAIGLRKYFDAAGVTTSIDPVGRVQLVGGLIVNSIKSLDVVGSLAIGQRVYFGDTAATVNVNPTGSLRVTGRMAGAITTDMTLEGALAKGVRVTVPTSDVAMAITTTGAISSKIQLQGNGSITLAPVGSLSRVRTLSGAVTKQLSIAGDLANNAEGEDIAPFLMTRKESNREMTR